MKECKRNTTEIAELADESHLFEKSLQEDLTEKFQTQIKKLEAIILNKKEEIKAITSYSEQAIEQLRETLRLLETTTKTLEQQLKDKETEITNLWTSYNYLQEKLQTNDESEIDLTTRFADATVRESGVSLTSQFENITGEETLLIENQNRKIEELQQQIKKQQRLLEQYGKEPLSAPVEIPEPTMAINTALVEKLGELVSREDRKSIPVYNGTGSGTPLYTWLKEAERVARNNDWNDVQKIRFFGDHLRGDAADWHTEFLENLEQATNYNQWKTSLKNTFQDDHDVKKL